LPLEQLKAKPTGTLLAFFFTDDVISKVKLLVVLTRSIKCWRKAMGSDKDLKITSVEKELADEDMENVSGGLTPVGCKCGCKIDQSGASNSKNTYNDVPAVITKFP
jgi:hypothetical protein